MFRDGNVHGETIRMLRSRAHWHPLVNGYSGHWPNDYRANREALNQFPDSTALDTIARLGVRYVMIDVKRYKPDDLAALQAQAEALPQVHLAYQDHRHLIYAIP